MTEAGRTVRLAAGAAFRDPRGQFRIAGSEHPGARPWVSAPILGDGSAPMTWDTHTGERVELRSPCVATMREALRLLGAGMDAEQAPEVGVPSPRTPEGILSHWETFRNDADSLFVLHRLPSGSLARTDPVVDFDPGGRWVMTETEVFSLIRPIPPAGKAQPDPPMSALRERGEEVSPFLPRAEAFPALPKFRDLVRALPMLRSGDAFSVNPESLYRVLVNAPSRVLGEEDDSDPWEGRPPRLPGFLALPPAGAWLHHTTAGLLPCTRRGFTLKHYLTVAANGAPARAAALREGLPRLARELARGGAGAEEVQVKFPARADMLGVGLDNAVVHWGDPSLLPLVRAAVEASGIPLVDRSSFGRDDLGVDEAGRSDGHLLASLACDLLADPARAEPLLRAGGDEELASPLLARLLCDAAEERGRRVARAFAPEPLRSA